MKNEGLKQATVILTCTCDHNYQDRKYGKKKRVHNRKAEKSSEKYSCTVCGKDK